MKKQAKAIPPAPTPGRIQDEKDYTPPKYGGRAPMFNECIDKNGVSLSTNAHPEIEYEHMNRMPTRRHGKWVRDGLNGHYESETKNPPMSERVRDQVFGSIGDRVGTMTSSSQLSHQRGLGQPGADGGLMDRAVRKGRC